MGWTFQEIKALEEEVEMLSVALEKTRCKLFKAEMKLFHERQGLGKQKIDGDTSEKVTLRNRVH
jgi:hypothetical protein